MTSKPARIAATITLLAAALAARAGYNPMDDLLSEAASTAAKISEAPPEELEKLKQDPRYQRYLNGGWEVFQNTKGAPRGEYCSALYWQQDSFLAISGPGGEYRGAMLTFWGPDIPQPLHNRKLRVTLKQTGDTGQTVQAFNYRKSSEPYGAIAFAVPSIEAALEGMNGAQGFEILVEGRRLLKLEWQDGAQAKQQMLDCLRR